MTKVEIEHVAKVGGILFEGLEETLEYLSGKYKLYIVSNCQKGYIEAFLEFHKLGKYFVDRENAENTGLSKGKNIRLVMARNGLENTVYVGDTIGDQNAAKEAEEKLAIHRANCEKLRAKLEREMQMMQEVEALVSNRPENVQVGM